MTDDAVDRNRGVVEFPLEHGNNPEIWLAPPTIKRRDNRWLVTRGIFILSDHRWKWQAALALKHLRS